MSITDSNGGEVGYLRYDLVAGEESAVLVVRVVPEDGATLISGSDPALVMQAREHGTFGPFQPLPAGLDLSGYDPGLAVLFDLRAVAGNVVGRARAAVWLGVITRGRAGWTD